YPTAIGWLPNEEKEMRRAQHSAWETIQRAHAIANGVFVAVVNRVGHEGQLNFWGQSFVADPFGRIIAKASSDKEEILIVDCDLDQIDETRQNWPSCAIGASISTARPPTVSSNPSLVSDELTDSGSTRL